MYAFVKFVSDSKTLVVEIHDIKKFKVNFDVNQRYKVKYSDGHFYKAYIIAVGETAEEATQKAAEKRVRIPSQRYTQEDTTQSEVSDDDSAAALNKKKDKRIETKGQKNCKAALESFRKLTETQTKTQLEPSESLLLLNQLKEQVKVMGSLINDRNDAEIHGLQQEVAELKIENQMLKEINYDLQNSVIKKFRETTKNGNEFEVPLASSEASLNIGDIRKNGNVYIGKDGTGQPIWLTTTIFDSICRKKKHTVFIKELAKAIFGDETLINSTVSGATANRPPLDPTKLLLMQALLKQWLTRRGIIDEEEQQRFIFDMDRIITEKIQDLRRPPKPQKTKKKLTVNDETINRQDEDRHRREGSEEISQNLRRPPRSQKNKRQLAVDENLTDENMCSQGQDNNNLHSLHKSEDEIGLASELAKLRNEVEAAQFVLNWD